MKVVRECLICKKQALHVVLDRAGKVISSECIFCGPAKEEADDGHTGQ